MKELAEIKAVGESFIKGIEDRSDSLMSRVRLTFQNGYGLSIIRGEYSYGGPQGLFEIAPLDKQGELDGSLLNEEDQGDDVLGHCDLDKVKYYIKKIGSM